MVQKLALPNSNAKSVHEAALAIRERESKTIFLLWVGQEGSSSQGPDLT